MTVKSKPNNTYLLWVGLPLAIIGFIMGAYGIRYEPEYLIIGFCLASVGSVMVIEYWNAYRRLE